MKKKKIKKFIYEGLGFPIVLENVPIINFHGETVPDIDYNQLQKAVLLHLCHKSSPLTGNEIKFIRKYFEMTLAEFGKKFGCSHVAVIKWEKFGNKFAKIEPTTDICIRLFVFSQLNTKDSAFRRLYDELDITELLKYRNQARDSMLEIDLQDVLKKAG
jgi:transcriptional regulator with XRE-family HTH domain